MLTFLQYLEQEVLGKLGYLYTLRDGNLLGAVRHGGMIPGDADLDAVMLLPLDETLGWVKDPKNSLKTWWRPTQCEMIQVLSALSAVRILGDFSRATETIALDDVRFVQPAPGPEATIPLCAQGSADAIICTCP